MLPQIDGYKQEYQELILDKDAIDLYLVKQPNPEVLFRGRLYPAPLNSGSTHIFIEGVSNWATPDSFGRFQLTVQRNVGERVRVEICEGNRQVYDSFETVTKDEIAIVTRKPDYQRKVTNADFVRRSGNRSR